MKKIISLLLLGFMMPLGASAEVDTFMSISPLQSYLTNMSADLSEVGENDSVSDAGNFILKGEPGKGQGNKYNLHYTGKNSTEKWSFVNMGNKKLNESIKVKPGFYAVRYEGSTIFIEIRKDQTIEVSLKKIKIYPKKSRYKVYRDFSFKEERIKARREVWGKSLTPSFLTKEYCDKIEHETAKKYCEELLKEDFSERIKSYCYEFRSDEVAKKYCDTFFSEDFSVFSKLIMFNSESEWLEKVLTCKESNRSKRECSVELINTGRRYVTHSYSNEKEEFFVSVLPGAYKVEFNR